MKTISGKYHIAFVVAEPWHTTAWTTDVGLLVQALRAMGHQSSVTCTQIVGDPAPYPTTEATLAEMSDPAYWQKREVTIAVVFNWLIRGGTVLTALREAGAFVLQFGDSDGLEGMRVHPQAQLTRMWHLRKNWPGKCEGIATLIRKYLYTHRKEDTLLLTNLETAHLTTLTSESGRRAFLRFVRWTGRTDLMERIRVLHSPLAPSFLTAEIVRERKPSLVAVGRWHDPQKDAPLLVKALRGYLPTAPTGTEVRLIGSGGEPFFHSLTEMFPQVKYLGRVPHTEMAKYLSTARILMFSSRWEGVPVVSLEMVALGGTVVGPAALPGIASYSEVGCGTTATQRTPQALCDALRIEMQLWEQKQRDPNAIATYWRPRLSSENQAQQILEWAEEANKSIDKRTKLR